MKACFRFLRLLFSLLDGWRQPMGWTKSIPPGAPSYRYQFLSNFTDSIQNHVYSCITGILLATDILCHQTSSLSSSIIHHPSSIIPQPSALRHLPSYIIHHTSSFFHLTSYLIKGNEAKSSNACAVSSINVV